MPGHAAEARRRPCVRIEPELQATRVVASLGLFFDVDSTYPCLTSSPWTAVVNVLLLGDRRVVCEASQLPTIEFFEQIGYRVIRCPFMHFLPFGGSFHCATTDVRRRGGLESYF